MTDRHHPLFADVRITPDAKHLAFTVRGMHHVVLNALRRCILTDVPTLAIDYNPTAPRFPENGVWVRSNTSPLHNEMLGHRFALLPVCANEKQVLDVIKGGTGRFAYACELRVRNDDPTTRLVTSKDITLVDANTGAAVRDPALRDALFPADPLSGDHVLLTKLPPGGSFADGTTSEVDVLCSIVLGTEARHSRWCPVSACYFTNTVDERAAAQGYEQLAARQKEETGSVHTSAQQFATLSALRYFKKDERGLPAECEFRLESECGLRAPFLVFQGLRLLGDKVRRLVRALETKDANKVAVVTTAQIAAARDNHDARFKDTPASAAVPTTDPAYGMHNIVVADEDHTCGSLVQALLYEDGVRGSGEVEYIGYHQPHPLEPNIVFRVKLRRDDVPLSTWFAGALIRLEQRLRAYENAWVDFMNMRRRDAEYYVDEFQALSQAA